ncbi:serine/threonine protein kinase [Euhalothece natronophila]|uniref:serine/threonine protein kinase n=1 Tax=Euhalothece natronophila TaxID=577489 RepID=UPI001C99A529|nr:serine/threonine-protein kinase [Euhalothece natronophila]
MNNQVGKIISDRFQIRRELGQGGLGITYSAFDQKTQQEVALKAISLNETDSWKVLELFEREVQSLQRIEHPNVPYYVDFLKIDTPNNYQLYLVQELAEGKSLDQLIEDGWKPSEVEIKSIAKQVLDVLNYIHNLEPPIIHRDIKPQNLIYQSNGNVKLVDFGAVKNTFNKTQFTNILVGTYGYMAPEQYQGQSSPSTDLYGLGATIAYLVTGQSIAELAQDELKPDVQFFNNLSPTFADWLEKMLEPAAEDRFSSAKTALTVLKNPNLLASSETTSKPIKSGIQVENSSELLEVIIPRFRLGLSLLWNLLFTFYWVTISISFGIAIILLLSRMLFEGSLDGVIISILVLLLILKIVVFILLIGFYYLWWLVNSLNKAFLKIILRVSYEKMKVIWEWNFFGLTWKSYKKYSLEEVEIKKEFLLSQIAEFLNRKKRGQLSQNASEIKVDGSMKMLYLYHNGKKYMISGARIFKIPFNKITELEQDWLQEEINNYIQQKQS